MAWSGGNGRVLIDSNWISRAHTVLTAHGIVLFTLPPRLHLNWTQFGWFALVTFFFFWISHRKQKKWVGSRFFLSLCNRRMNCSGSQCFFLCCFLISVCRLVVHWLRGWYVSLPFVDYDLFFFSASNFLFCLPKHRRWPAICASTNTISTEREREESKRKKIRNELFICTNKWKSKLDSVYSEYIPNRKWIKFMA